MERRRYHLAMLVPPAAGACEQSLSQPGIQHIIYIRFLNQRIAAEYELQNRRVLAINLCEKCIIKSPPSVWDCKRRSWNSSQPRNDSYPCHMCTTNRRMCWESLREETERGKHWWTLNLPNYNNNNICLSVREMKGSHYTVWTSSRAVISCVDRFQLFFFLIVDAIESLIVCNQRQFPQTISFFIHFAALSFRCIITQYNETYLSAR